MLYVILLALYELQELIVDADNTSDNKIASEIERLREEFTDTQELYREVCVLLFFRHGITPTANKLYQLVHKGSMSAPSEALRVFWEELREKSRVRIEHPDLPETLKISAGDLVATLWTQAQAAANENLATLREEASLAVTQAQAAQAAAEKEATHLQEELTQARQRLQSAHDRSLQLERDISAEKANREALGVQLEAAGQQQRVLEAALAEARREFSAELEKLRHTHNQTEERLQGSEKRALLEIDRERTVSNRLQQEIQQLRQIHQELINSHQIKVTDLQKRSTEMTQKLGQAEGMLQMQKETIIDGGAQLDAMCVAVRERETQIALMERDQELSGKKILSLEAELAKSHQQKPVKETTRRRKSTF
jgi:Plasmid replication region DNA-binding N-term